MRKDIKLNKKDSAWIKDLVKDFPDEPIVKPELQVEVEFIEVTGMAELATAFGMGPSKARSLGVRYCSRCGDELMYDVHNEDVVMACFNSSCKIYRIRQ